MAASYRGLKITELAGSIWHEAQEDNLLGRAAELAYFFLLALFPFLIFLLSALTFIPGAQQTMFRWVARLMPSEATALLRAWVEDVFEQRSEGLLSFGLIFSLVAASSGMAALMDALNIAYEVKEGRSFLKSRFIALFLTIAVFVLVGGGAVLITLSNRLVSWFGSFLNMNQIEYLIPFIGFFIGLLMLILGLGLVYYVAPNVRQRWKPVTPGSLFAVVALVAASYGFSAYLRIGPEYDATYGSLGAVVVLMLWLYLVALSLMIGAEINSEIDKLKGKQRVEKQK